MNQLVLRPIGWLLITGIVNIELATTSPCGKAGPSEGGVPRDTIYRLYIVYSVSRRPAPAGDPNRVLPSQLWTMWNQTNPFGLSLPQINRHSIILAITCGAALGLGNAFRANIWGRWVVVHFHICQGYTDRLTCMLHRIIAADRCELQINWLSLSRFIDSSRMHEHVHRPPRDVWYEW